VVKRGQDNVATERGVAADSYNNDDNKTFMYIKQGICNLDEKILASQ